MPRFVAFLRAVNVGGRTVKMDHLRQLFEALGHAGVETYIASGNVVFDSPANDPAVLEAALEQRLHAALGFEVATFLRTTAELAAVAAHRPAGRFTPEETVALNVAFLKQPPAPPAVARLMSLRSEVDDFEVHGREVYWSCRVRQSDSKFSNAVLEKALASPATLRGASTLAKMAAKFAPARD